MSFKYRKRLLKIQFSLFDLDHIFYVRFSASYSKNSVNLSSFSGDDIG
ncbi:hypothetical protein HPSD74_1441 [Glaesserella parasuis D74]|nr:hypothetical protein HPSD74_1441 [Glaesserella parasuis D74]